MKKLSISLLAVLTALFSAIGIGVTALADDQPVALNNANFISAIAADTDGSFYLEEDIVLDKDSYIPTLLGALDGRGYSVTIDNNVGLIENMGNDAHRDATVKNLTVKGVVTGARDCAGVAANAIGIIENVVVEADISSTNNREIAGFANCNGKYTVKIIDCAFAGTITFKQGFTSASNYPYFGIFFGYNGGAMGGGTIINSFARYTFTIPTAEVEKVKEIEFFNINGDGDTAHEGSVPCEYTSKQDGNNTVYTFDCVVNMKGVTPDSVNDEGIMANYGTPVVRFTLKDNSYRYIDGFDRANAKYVTDFHAESFDKMYAYKDISYLEVEEIGKESMSGSLGGVDGSITSTYSMVTVNTEEEFESFVRIINSAIPATFKDAKTKENVNFSILNTLAISVKLGDNITLDGDANGNPSEFYGIGKHEFYPYRGGIDGNGKSLTVNINAPNGYLIGIIANVSEMKKDIEIKNLTVNGSITGNTKVGLVGYFDMVCNEYVAGGDLVFTNVVNNADITGKVGVGGFVGVTTSAKNKSVVKITDCKQTGDVTLLDGGRYAGGFIGVAGFYLKAGATIKNCVNEGNVIAGDNTKFVGGIAGELSSDLSSIKQASFTGELQKGQNVTVAANCCGKTGAIETDANPEDIASYDKTDLSTIAFKENTWTSGYGSYYELSFNKGFTPNYTLKMLFFDEDEQPVAVGEDGGQPIYELGWNTNREYKVKLDPGKYTVKVKAYNTDGYLKDTSIPAEGKLLSATAEYTVTKKELSYSFANVTTPATGDSIDYFSALKKENPSIKDSKITLPEGAEWVVSYYSGQQKLDAAPTTAGEYTVKLEVNVTDALFNDRYTYETAEYTATLTIQPIITVKVKDVTITKGLNATFEVEVTTYDGTVFTNTSALNLSYTVEGFGTSFTAALTVGTYTVLVTGLDEVNGYVVEYESGTLIITNADSGDDSEIGNGDKEGLPIGAIIGICAAVVAIVVAVGVVFAIKFKKQR